MTPDHKSVNTPYEEVKGHAWVKVTSSFHVVCRRYDFLKIFEIFDIFPVVTP